MREYARRPHHQRLIAVRRERSIPIRVVRACRWLVELRRRQVVLQPGGQLAHVIDPVDANGSGVADHRADCVADCVADRCLVVVRAS